MRDLPGAHVAAGLALLAFGVLFAYDSRRTWQLYPQEWPVVLIALGFYGVFFSALLIASRRLLLASLGTLGLFVLISTIGYFKWVHQGSTLQIFDAKLYATSETIGFLLAHYGLLVGGVVVGLLLGIAAIVLVTRREATVARWTGVASGGVSVVAALAGFAALPELGETFYFFRSGHGTAFFVSLANLQRTDDVPSLFKVRKLAAPAAAPAGCELGERPDIIAVLHESATPFAADRVLSEPREVADFFAPAAGISGPLRVETWGGGTWVSEISFLTGVPLAPLGRLRTYAPLILAGHLRESMVRQLSRCGYRTVAIMPTPFNYVAMGPRYREMGFDEVIPRGPARADDGRVRDRDYYQRALEVLGRSSQPTFVYVVTLAAHGPYNYRFDPAESVGLKPGADAGFAEYARRMVMSARDYAAFKSALDRRGDRETVIVRFGDHHPALPGVEAGGTSFTTVDRDRERNRWFTFYALERTRGRPKTPERSGVVDIFTLPLLLGHELGARQHSRRATIVSACNYDVVGCRPESSLQDYLDALFQEGSLAGTLSAAGAAPRMP